MILIIIVCVFAIITAVYIAFVSVRGKQINEQLRALDEDVRRLREIENEAGRGDFNCPGCGMVISQDYMFETNCPRCNKSLEDGRKAAYENSVAEIEKLRSLIDSKEKALQKKRKILIEPRRNQLGHTQGFSLYMLFVIGGIVVLWGILYLCYHFNLFG